MSTATVEAAPASAAHASRASRRRRNPRNRNTNPQSDQQEQQEQTQADHAQRGAGARGGRPRGRGLHNAATLELVPTSVQQAAHRGGRGAVGEDEVQDQGLAQTVSHSAWQLVAVSLADS
ncbi:hypothetical protein PTTW11_08879 [Pyrenophora teres f. teres]|uniref:Uncharacterized protein n=1 Tax=Pyrenophora teres f. teres TaxID=97479 RepID=A0A6S6WA52_9PLEO|nr:hypothetical protein PTTW11_08879 [Pyrenophora teres f. teres]